MRKKSGPPAHPPIGAGCAAGAPAIAVGAVAEVHGSVTAGAALIHLAKSASGNYEKTAENKRLTSEGKAPIGNDGHKVELHHPNQSPQKPVKEMTRTNHRGAGNFTKNHPFGNKRPTQIDKAAAAKFRHRYWKKQHEKDFKNK